MYTTTIAGQTIAGQTIAGLLYIIGREGRREGIVVDQSESSWSSVSPEFRH